MLPESVAASFGHCLPAATRKAAAPKRAAHVPLVVAGRYRLIESIGRGGMGVVYRALQLDLRREVALKILTPPRQMARPDEARRRFLHEAGVAARLSHPHAVCVFDAGVDGDLSYLAMELLRGESLQSALRARRLEVRDALEIGRQIGSALLAAHQAGALHRDIKPGNVFLLAPHNGAERAPFAKLLDFGLTKQFAEPFAELTHTGQRLGSPHYMAPEQVLGQPVDARCDVFGLGGVLFEMLCGRPLNQEREPRAAMKAQVEALAPLPSQSGLRAQDTSPQGVAAIDALVQQALEKEPERRFGSVAAMLQAIEHAQHLVPAHWGPQAAPEATRLLAPAPRRPVASADGGWRLGALPRSASASGASPAGHRVSFGEASQAEKERAVGRWPLVAAMGAAIGLLGGASWQHAPRWIIEASPAAQAVYLGGHKVCETTPCTIRWHREDVGKPATVLLTRPGYDDALVTRAVQRNNKTVRVRLHPPETTGSEKTPATPR